MRTYGRVGGVWQEIITNPVTGDNSLIWITTLLQNLLLNQGESPFYAQNGIPAQQAVNSQILPKIAIANIQKQFSPYFASLIISQESTNPPTYAVNVLTLQGASFNAFINGVPR